MIKIIITKDKHGEMVDVRRWTPIDCLRTCLWAIKDAKRRKHWRYYLKEVLTGVLLCSFGVPAHMKPDNAYSLALDEARRQHETGRIKTTSVQFKYC